MPGPSSPTLRRWELGAALRRIRESQEKTIEQVSHDLSELYGVGFSPAKISRLENAKRGVNPRDVRDLCEYYGVAAAERDRLMQLAKASREHDRWVGIPEGYATFVALESIASRERGYESMFVPGLLQTPEYSRVIEGVGLPGLDQDSQTPERIAARVSLRDQRQQRLRSADPLELHLVVDENVLRRVAGGAEVMRAQLEYLIEVSRLPNVILQAMPIASGLYAGSEASTYVLLDFPEGEAMPDDVCYVEGILGTMWVERDADLRRINRVYNYLQIAALSPAGTRDFIASIIRETA
jgi:transcriptional regulator with XRE-family HTH domain